MKTEYTESDHKIVGKTVCDMISHTRTTGEYSVFYDKKIDLLVIVRPPTDEEKADLLSDFDKRMMEIN